MAEIVGLKTVDLDLTTASGVAVDLAGQNLSDGQFVAGIETVFAQQNGLCALEVDLTNIDLFPQQ